MEFEIGGARPRVDSTAIVAPTAVLSGDVTVGTDVVVSFGAVILGDDAPVVIGPGTIVRENVVIRAGSGHPLRIGSNVLVGAQSALYGCTIDDEVFLATGVTVFHGARVGARAEVRRPIDQGERVTRRVLQFPASPVRTVHGGHPGTAGTGGSN